MSRKRKSLPILENVEIESVAAEGKCVAILTSEDNVVCELTFVDGVLESIKEIG